MGWERMGSECTPGYELALSDFSQTYNSYSTSLGRWDPTHILTTLLSVTEEREREREAEHLCVTQKQGSSFMATVLFRAVSQKEIMSGMETKTSVLGMGPDTETLSFIPSWNSIPRTPSDGCGSSASSRGMQGDEEVPLAPSHTSAGAVPP